MKKNFAIRLCVCSAVLIGLLGAASPRIAGQTKSTPPQAVPSSPVASELANARALEHRNRIDLAVPVWKSVLQVEPKNTEALAGLARAAAISGDSTLASMYLDRLRSINPADPNIARVQNIHPAAGTAPPNSSVLAWKDPAGSSQRPRTPVEAAYQALDAKRIGEAESRFKAILAHEPHNPAALAGMGYVRLQQNNYMGAISYLEQARRARPNDHAVADALESARFHFLVGEADKALAAGDAVTAEKHYRSALELRRDNPDALTGLGQALLARNDPASATAVFQQAVSAAPGSQVAWRGLVLAASRSGNPSTAVAADERMPESVHTTLHADAAYLEALASAQMLVGRSGDAQGSLETAARLATDAASKRAAEVQLGSVLLARNQPQRAGELYRGVIAADPSNVLAWQGLIESEHQLGRDDEALSEMDRMPQSAHDQAIKDPGFSLALARVYRSQKRFDLAQQLLEKVATEQAGAADPNRVPIQLELAGIDVENGRPQLAYPLYQQVLREQPDRADAWAGLVTTLHLTGHDREAIEQAALIPPAVRVQLASNPAYLEAMGAAYAVTGHPDNANQLLGREELGYQGRSATMSPDVALENAWLLYTSANDKALYPELMALGGRTDLNDAQRKTVQTIWADWALRRAGQAADSGNPTGAIAILNAAADEFATNVDVQRSLASGFLRAGDAQRATDIFKAQNMTSASSGDYQTAISAALAAGDTHNADAWLKYALAKYPADPQLLLLKARSEQARGDTRRAQQYYQQSLNALPPESKQGSAPLPDTALPAGSSGQRLAALLIPPGVQNTQAAPPTPAPAEASAATPTPATAAANAAGYRSFTPYIAPPRPTPAPDIVAATGKAEVPVQLGNNAAPPVQQPTEMTDVLPTPRYVGPGARKGTLASDPNAAAAQAERVRRQRAEEAARRGQSHPPSDQSTALVPQPATPPAPTGTVPDTGTQQYPQPRTPPAPVRRPAPRAPATAATTTQPEQPPAPMQPAPVVSATPPPPQPPVFVAPPQSEGEVATHTASPPALMAAQAPIGTATPRQQAQNALAAIESSYSGFAGGTGFGRFRNGTAGVDRLYDVEAPVEASVVLHRTARITAIAQPVFLNSGVLGGTAVSVPALPYIGTLATASTSVPPQQSSNGIGGELQLSTRLVGVAAGYTPYQFLVHNMTARVRLAPLGERFVLYAERQPVKDTQLSYAGLRDPGVSTTTGPVWGGVIATTGGVRAGTGNDASGFLVDAEGGVLTGRHVLDNYLVRGTASARFRVTQWTNGGSLSLGGLFTGMHYQHNEYGVSYGHGGYFSPAWYFGAGVPVTVRGGADTNFHYDIQASAGVRTFRQDAAALFPLDPALQGRYPACVSGVLNFACGYYPQTVSTGFDYAVNGEFSYRFAQRWYSAAFVRSTNRNNYQDVSAGFFLRYTFHRQSTAEGRPTGLFVSDGIRPLQIP